MKDEIAFSKDQLIEWVESLISMNHLGTLVNREIAAGNLERASQLAERSRNGAWKMLNELFEYGVDKPEGYCEPENKTHN
jgi:hypothetical protein